MCMCAWRGHLSYLESDDLHAEDCGVKADGVRHAFHCEDQMIQVAHLNWTGSFESDNTESLDGEGLQETRQFNSACLASTAPLRGQSVPASCKGGILV